MAEEFARLAEEPNRLPRESAVLLHLSQSWAVFGWATELLGNFEVEEEVD